ncbi:LPS export ABC transporter periplasmic protein LptC [Candidatus Pelagibacter sp. HIMB1748]|uniref:LPS export ABC transporter periplasmic protein LptC n=1 Tax=unclassified Candidatus Pelagibacter TaxID=2647897 RepID=UPI003F82B245
MHLNKNVKVIFALFIIFLIIFFIYSKNKIQKNKNVTETAEEEITYNSNIIEDIEYKSKDNDGNEYSIFASMGEIDVANPNILFLTKVSALIKLTNSEEVTINSDFGKYNSENFDTIFSKNVKINYLKNKITGDYLDFSLQNNVMIISKNITFTNEENVLNADVIELDIKTKNTKIFMHEEDKKVNIKSKD